MSLLLLTLAASVHVAGSTPEPRCSPATVLPVTQRPTSSFVLFKKLGDLPDADEIHPVLRSVNGCPVAEVMRFHVSSPGGYVPGGVLVPSGGGRVDTGQGH